MMVEDQTTTVYYNPGWIATAGGYLHPNNVLWYFAQSPFFDPTSQNGELIAQYGGTPFEGQLLGSKQGWHHQLRLRRGISYVIFQDPIETNTQVEGPHGKEVSNVWVIRKQQRDEPEDENVKVLGFYYIINDAIYEAPSVASILSTRMLNTTTALSTLFSTASELPIFSAAHGHTYRKPAQKPVIQSQSEGGTQSKEGTPAPTQDSSAAEKESRVGDPAVPATGQDSWVLDFALRRTLQHGKEYSDEKPLMGEPGKLRYSTTKDQANVSKQPPSQLSSSRNPTPAYSRAVSAIPGLTPAPTARPIKQSPRVAN